MYADRRPRYEQLEQARDSKLLVYVTGDRSKLATQISSDGLDFFVDHLDRIGVTGRLSLFLYTRGGETLAAWNLLNLMRTFCDELEVIVPSKAYSAGTLMALGADRIVMTKQAALGPIDPSVNTPLNPEIPGGTPNARAPVNVENVNAFLDFAAEAIGKKGDQTQVFLQLAEAIHPLVLGQAYRSRSQIRMLARRLLSNHMTSQPKIDRVLDFLCSKSGSHDYTLNRREAVDLGLPVENPDGDLYEIIKAIYDDVASELELTTPYDPSLLLAGQPTATYCLPRALIESYEGGSDVFVSEGQLDVQQIESPQGVRQDAIQDRRQYEGWRHTDA